MCLTWAQMLNVYEYVSHEFLPLINWSFLNHSIFAIADGLADITQLIVSNVFSITVRVVGNSFWFHDKLIMGLTISTRKQCVSRMIKQNGQVAFNKCYIYTCVYYSHKTSSLSSTFVSWTLASFVTWQRSIWSWSAGESKSVKRDELEKLAEPVWLLLLMPIELTKIKIPLEKNNTYIY